MTKTINFMLENSSENGQFDIAGLYMLVNLICIFLLFFESIIPIL